MEVPVREKLLTLFLIFVFFTSCVSLTYLLIMPTPIGTAVESIERR